MTAIKYLSFLTESYNESAFEYMVVAQQGERVKLY